MVADKVFGWIRDAAPAALGVPAAQAVGTAVMAPGWLIGVGQAAIVVVFTVKAIDKRQSRLHERINETTGKLEVLMGMVKALPCVTDPSALPVNCPGKGCEGCKC